MNCGALGSPRARCLPAGHSGITTVHSIYGGRTFLHSTFTKEFQLRARRPPERGGGKLRATFVQARATACHLKQLRDLFGEKTFAFHARSKLRFVQLAAAHLQITPPNLPEARLSIDAMASVVDGLKGRLGPDESTLIDALAQIRMAYVQVQASIAQ